MIDYWVMVWLPGCPATAICFCLMVGSFDLTDWADGFVIYEVIHIPACFPVQSLWVLAKDLHRFFPVLQLVFD
jgi:hypothetical protein